MNNRNLHDEFGLDLSNVGQSSNIIDLRGTRIVVITGSAYWHQLIGTVSSLQGTLTKAFINAGFYVQKVGVTKPTLFSNEIQLSLMFSVLNQYSVEQVRQSVMNVLAGLGNNLITDIDLYVTEDASYRKPSVTVTDVGTGTFNKPKTTKVILRKATSSNNVVTIPAKVYEVGESQTDNNYLNNTAKSATSSVPILMAGLFLILILRD